MALVLALAVPFSRAAEPKPLVREIYVPYDTLDVILQSQPRRVMMARPEYEELLRQAAKTPETHAPKDAMVVAADYTADARPQRVEITGRLTIDVLEDGPRAVALGLSGTGPRTATLDGKPAAIRSLPDRTLLVVEGRGRHELVLAMVAPLETTAAQQVLRARLPRAPASRMHLTVPGDVEVKSGADVASRIVDKTAGVTRFELVPPPAEMTLVMSLNSHLARRERAVVARSVLVDEVTQAYERIHATVSLAVLHQAVDHFRFTVPAGFEVTEVGSPLLSKWSMAAEGGAAGLLDVTLREPTTETVVLGISALRAAPPAAKWTMPRLEPQEVVGQASVVGLLVDAQLRTESLAAKDLIAIDTDVLRRAIPASVFRAEPGAPSLYAAAAYYAPQAAFALDARFVRPPAELDVTTSILLLLQEKGAEARGSFLIAPQSDRVFRFEFSVPAEWQVTAVTKGDGGPLAYETYGEPGQAGRVLVGLPQGVKPSQSERISFTAAYRSSSWLAADSAKMEFPVFAAPGATRDTGAIGVEARGDMSVRPDTLVRLTPLDAAQKEQYGLAGVTTNLVYRYERQPDVSPAYQATIAIGRTRPRLTARTFSCFRVQPAALDAHYEIAYRVDDAATRELSLVLPQSTPKSLAIRGLGGLKLKEFSSREADGGRRWDVLLEDSRRGDVSLAVDFQQPLGKEESKGIALPVVAAADVVYQSGLVSIEGSPELQVAVHTKARPVDVGELVDAQYQPGRGLLGVYSFVGDPQAVSVDVSRDPAYALTPSIVQKALLECTVSSNGVAQSWARFQLRTKALYLEVELPEGADLWSAHLDEQPIKPQLDRKRLVVSLPAAELGQARTLQLVYQQPIAGLGLTGRVRMDAPRLLLRAAAGSKPEEVPLADLEWRLHLPHGYEVTRCDGTVSTEIKRPSPALLTIASTAGEAMAVSPMLLEAGKSARGTKCAAPSAVQGLAMKSEAPAAGDLVRKYYTDRSESMPAAETEEKAAEERPAEVAAEPANPSPPMEELAGAKPAEPLPKQPAAGPEMPPAGAPPVVPGLSATKGEVGGQPLSGVHAGALGIESKPPSPVLEPRTRLRNPVPPPSRVAGAGGSGEGFEGRGDGYRNPLLESRLGDGSYPVAPQTATTTPAAPAPENKPADGKFAGDPFAAPQTPPAGPQGVNGTLADFDARFDLGKLAAHREKPSSYQGRSKGLSILKIDYRQEEQSDQDAVVFRSLGVEPRLDVRVIHRPRFELLGWALGSAVVLAGLALTRRSAKSKARYLVLVLAIASLLPLVPGLGDLWVPANRVVYLACWLVPYYLLAACIGWLMQITWRVPRWPRRSAKTPVVTPPPGGTPPAAAATAILLALVLSGTASAEKPPANQAEIGGYAVQLIEPDKPVKVPDDAVILPYDVDSNQPVRGAASILVPYAKYVELWDRAHPDKKLSEPKPPVPYALAGAEYKTALAGEDFLLVDGRLEIEVYTDDFASIPLGLEGGVLARAELDGKPAKLSVIAPAPSRQGPPQQAAGQPMPQQQDADPFGSGAMPQTTRGLTRPARHDAVLLLHVAGKGRHVLQTSVRVHLERRGGSRVAEGVLPTAPAASLTLTVPDARTEVRLGSVLDRRSYDTEKPQERIETALAPSGVLNVQWRPKVAEAQVDRSLTVQSSARLDVEEDGLLLTWDLSLEFPRSQREVFGVEVPEEYLVEKVEGQNVRGWEVRREGGRQKVEVTLLNAAREKERFTVKARREGAVGRGELAEFDVPLVTVPDAALHHGEVALRRSPLLDLRPVRTEGVTRTDQAAAPGQTAAVDESPLGLKPYQTYRFVTTPFALRLAVEPVREETEAELESVLRIAEYDQSIEARVVLDARQRPLHQAAVRLPEGFELESVSAPGEFHWAATGEGPRKLLTVYLAAGQQGRMPLVIRGKLGRGRIPKEMPLPRLEIEGVTRQQGDLAVLVDPSYDASLSKPEQCESVLVGRLAAWLNPQQQRLARLAIHHRGKDYRGTLQFTARQPVVTCDTVTNVRVTDRAVEETIFLDFNVEHAGLREVLFRLPAWMKDARIEVPNLRQKTVEPAGREKDSPVRVRLAFQDSVVGQIRVFVSNDRLLEPGPQTAPVPVVETGRTDRQFVALESAGRDEVEVVKHPGLELLTRQQRDWARLAEMLSGNITQAYAVSQGQSPQLVFQTRQRAALQTAKARIGLAVTTLVLDVHGAYRAELVLHVDNSTEQFLEIKLPEGAKLWTARVSGSPVKPTRAPGATDPRKVRIPLVKTAPGDLDYPVVLKYGGEIGQVGSLDRIDFPLIQTVNLKVELSNAQLYLPETHRWFDFGGKMRLANETGLAAQEVSHLGQQVGLMLQTAHGEDPYAQARSLSNLKSLEGALESLKKRTMGGRPSGGEVQLGQQVDRQIGTLQDAEKDLSRLSPAAQTPAADNRAKLYERFKEQKGEISGNVIRGLERNFEEPAQQAQPAQEGRQQAAGQQGAFNPTWLDQSRLNRADEGQKALEGRRLLRPQPAKPQGGKAKSGAAPLQRQLLEPQSQTEQTVQPTQPPAPQGEMESLQQKASRYQQEYSKKQAAQQEAAGIQSERLSKELLEASAADKDSKDLAGKLGDRGEQDAVNAPADRSELSFGYAVTEGGVSAEGGQTTRGFAFGGQTRAGLASLDVEIPKRGQRYCFLTPQGDVSITARAASRDLLAGLARTAEILAVALAIWLAVTLAASGRLARLASPGLAGGMIVLAIILFCFLPVLSLVLILASVMLLLQRSANKPRAGDTPLPARR